MESQSPASNEPTLATEPVIPPIIIEPIDRKVVTTVERKPMIVPDTVHVRITPETLKEYVGPPVYQKDRMYVHPPPPGVSTGLGYLGNGSGAVMPVEAMVGFVLHHNISCKYLTSTIFRACQVKVAFSSRVNSVKSFARVLR